nr:IS5 family transposase [Janibacter cremeus]
MRRWSLRSTNTRGSATRTWKRFSRSTPPACEPTSTRPAPAMTRSSRTRRRTQGGHSSYTNSRIVPGEPPDHALGRSRGGLTTKIHALSDLTCTPVMALLSAGQAGDNPMLTPLIDALAEAGHGMDFRLLADKAYSHPSTRAYLRDKRIKHTIPQRRDQITQRKNKGSKGGRPPGFDAGAYKQRNTVERSFSRAKQWRGLATRYDKYAVTYLGGVLLAMVILTHRAAR